MPSKSETEDTPRPTSYAAPSTGDGRSSTDDSDAATAADRRVDRDPIEWGPVRYNRLRSVALGVSLVVAGGLLAVVAAVSVLAAGAAWTAVTAGRIPGDAWLWAVGALLLVGGPFSLVTLLIAYDRSADETRERFKSAFDGYSIPRESIRPRWIGVGAGSVAALWVWGSAAVDSGLFYLFPLVWVVPVLLSSEETSVRLDPSERVVERTVPERNRTRSDDLGAVVRTRRVDLPWTTVFLLAYRGNAWYRSTPWLFAPTDRADAVESALNAVLAESDGPDRASVSERLTLAVLGSFSLVVGLAMATAGGEGTAGLALTLLSAPVSGLLIALAARL